MNRKKRIEQEVRKTLQCLDEMENIEANPFFYTRLQAKMQGLEAQQGRSARKIFSMAHLRFALLVVLVVINVVSMTVVLKTSQSESSDDRQTNITAFADEYALTQSDTNLFMSN